MSMRVIAGRLRGRRLFVLPGLSIRPTIGRLRESYFDIVQDRIDGARFLDLCSGSGSVGIEALSRGAAQVVFVEKSHRAVQVLRRNLDHCGIGSGYRLLPADIFQEIPRLAREGDRFDLVYFDPPYFRDLYDRTLDLLAQCELLAPNGLLAANHFKKILLPDTCGALRRIRVVQHGDSTLSFYGWASPHA
jgi:16S rRNA (guanine966-N2)-methyltransferase